MRFIPLTLERVALVVCLNHHQLQFFVCFYKKHDLSVMFVSLECMIDKADKLILSTKIDHS